MPDDATRPAMERRAGGAQVGCGAGAGERRAAGGGAEDEESGACWQAAAALIDCGETALAPLPNAPPRRTARGCARAHHVFSNTQPESAAGDGRCRQGAHKYPAWRRLRPPCVRSRHCRADNGKLPVLSPSRAGMAAPFDLAQHQVGRRPGMM